MQKTAGQSQHEISERARSSKRGCGVSSTSLEYLQGGAILEMLFQEVATPLLKLLKLIKF